MAKILEFPPLKEINGYSNTIEKMEYHCDEMLLEVEEWFDTYPDDMRLSHIERKLVELKFLCGEYFTEEED